MRQKALLLRLAEEDPVVRARSDQQRGRQDRGEQRDEVDVTLQMRRLREATRERDRQEKREQHLHAGQRHAELVQELDQLAVDPLLLVLVRHERLMLAAWNG